MKHTNRLLIYYKYNMYNYNDSKGVYRLIDVCHPHHDVNLSWFMQHMYNSTKCNIITYAYSVKNNPFISESTQIKVEKYFFEFQKFKRAMHYIVNKIRMKYCKIHNDMNLMYEPLSKGYIQLYENNQIYNFDFNEIYKIVHNSFYYSESMIPQILYIKNPYTNNKFSDANIYNIYFYLMKNFKIPHLFHAFILENMSIKNTEMMYDEHLYIKSLEKNYNEMQSHKKVFQIHCMLKYVDMKQFLIISRTELLTIFSKICKNYYIFINLVLNNFNISYATKTYKAKFVKFMHAFWKKNRRYGRKIYKRNMMGEVYSYEIHKNLVY